MRDEEKSGGERRHGREVLRDEERSGGAEDGAVEVAAVCEEDICDIKSLALFRPLHTRTFPCSLEHHGREGRGPSLPQTLSTVGLHMSETAQEAEKLRVDETAWVVRPAEPDSDSGCGERREPRDESRKEMGPGVATTRDETKALKAGWAHRGQKEQLDDDIVAAAGRQSPERRSRTS